MANAQWTLHEEHLLLGAVREFRTTQPRGRPVSWEAVYQIYQRRGGLVHGSDKLVNRLRKFKKMHTDGTWDTDIYGDSDTVFPPVVPPPPPFQPVQVPIQTTPVQVPIQTTPVQVPYQFQSSPNYPPNFQNAYMSGPGSSLPAYQNAYVSGPGASPPAYLNRPASSSAARLRSQNAIRSEPLLVSQAAKISQIALDKMNNKCVAIIRKLDLDNSEMQYTLGAIGFDRVTLIGLYYAKKDKRVDFIRQLMAHDGDDIGGF